MKPYTRSQFHLTAKATEASLLEVLAEVRLVVPPHGGPDVVWSPDGSLSPDAAACSVADYRVTFLEELAVVVKATVHLVVGLASRFLFREDRVITFDLSLSFIKRVQSVSIL